MIWAGRAFLLGVCLFALKAHAAIGVAPGPPDGFASLETPRAAYIAVSYGGESLGSFAAHTTPTAVRFDTPEAVLERIPAVADKATVMKALGLPLATNAGKRCRANFGEACARLTPETLGIVFDDQTLTAELFINPKLLDLRDTGAARYLPLPARELSSVYGFSGAVAGDGKAHPNYALNNQAIFAYGEGRLVTQSSLSDRGARIDTAAARIDRNGWEAQGGLFRSRALQLIADRDMAGIAAGTSTRTRLDAHKIEGNDIVLYLPRRANVSVYREGRLYSTRAYEAGNQAIETNELPEGAYAITLRIQEQDGSTREEQRFFAKSQDLPPPGDPTYYAQAGVERAPATDDSFIPKLRDDPIVRLGAIRRVDDDLGLSADLVYIEQRVASEIGSFYIHSGLQLRGTGMLSSKGDTGAQFSALYNDHRWSFNLDARAVWADSPAAVTTDPVTNLLTYNNRADEQNAFTDLQQAIAALNYEATPDLTLGLHASTSNQAAMHQSAYGPNLTWYLWREGETLLSFDADAGTGNDRFVANALLRFTMRLGDYGLNATGGYANGAGAMGNIRAFNDDRTAESERILGASLQHDRHADSIGADGDWRNATGRAHGMVQQSTGTRGGLTSYNSDFTVNMAQVDDELYVGGNESDLSAVIVSLSGDNDVPMAILVGSVAHGIVTPGGSRTLYLAPYQRYTISLKPTQNALVTDANPRREVTLYPGNVVRLQWQVNHFYVVAAQLLTPDGRPLANAALQEDDGRTVTNENGRLQIQLTQPHRLTFITPELEACEAVLPAMKPVNGILLYRQPLTCQPIPLS